MKKWFLLTLMVAGVGWIIKKQMPDLRRELKMMAM